MIFDILYYDENYIDQIMKIESKDIDQCAKDLIKIQDLKKDYEIDYITNYEDKIEIEIKWYIEISEYEDQSYGYIIKEAEDQNNKKFDTIHGSAFYEGTTKKENSLDKDINLLNACQKLEKALKND